MPPPLHHAYTVTPAAPRPAGAAGDAPFVGHVSCKACGWAPEDDAKLWRCSCGREACSFERTVVDAVHGVRVALCECSRLYHRTRCPKCHKLTKHDGWWDVSLKAEELNDGTPGFPLPVAVAKGDGDSGSAAAGAGAGAGGASAAGAGGDGGDAHKGAAAAAAAAPPPPPPAAAAAAPAAPPKRPKLTLPAEEAVLGGTQVLAKASHAYCGNSFVGISFDLIALKAAVVLTGMDCMSGTTVDSTMARVMTCKGSASALPGTRDAAWTQVFAGTVPLERTKFFHVDFATPVRLDRGDTVGIVVCVSENSSGVAFSAAGGTPPDWSDDYLRVHHGRYLSTGNMFATSIREAFMRMEYRLELGGL